MINRTEALSIISTATSAADARAMLGEAYPEPDVFKATHAQQIDDIVSEWKMQIRLALIDEIMFS